MATKKSPKERERELKNKSSIRKQNKYEYSLHWIGLTFVVLVVIVFTSASVTLIGRCEWQEGKLPTQHTLTSSHFTCVILGEASIVSYRTCGLFVCLSLTLLSRSVLFLLLLLWFLFRLLSSMNCPCVTQLAVIIIMCYVLANALTIFSETTVGAMQME